MPLLTSAYAGGPSGLWQFGRNLWIPIFDRNFEVLRQNLGDTEPELECLNVSILEKQTVMKAVRTTLKLLVILVLRLQMSST